MTENLSDKYAEFFVTNGTEFVSLLSPQAGFVLKSWKPQIAQAKGGGVWRSSQLLEGQQLIGKVLDTVDETLILSMMDWDRDGVNVRKEEFRTFLDQGVSYWLTRAQSDPLYLHVREYGETNPRYALLQDYQAPEDSDIYAPGSPLWVPEPGQDDWTLVIRRETGWRDNPPRQYNDTPVSAVVQKCQVYPLSFLDTAAIVDCGSAGALDNIPTAVGDFTIDGWIRIRGYGGTGGVNIGWIMNKSLNLTMGWRLAFSQANGLDFWMGFAVAAMQFTSGLDDLDVDEEWHHIAAVFVSATSTARLYVDGEEVSYVLTNAGNGAYIADAIANLEIGNQTALARHFNGDIGWIRLSSLQQYSGPFDPEPRSHLPEIFPPTIAVWIYEGEGATCYNVEGTAGTDGTVANADWQYDLTYLPYDEENQCLPLSFGNYEICYPTYMSFNALSSDVDCASPPALDNLPSAGDVTIDGWLRIYSTGEGGNGRVFTKGLGVFDADTVAGSNNLGVLAQHGVQNANSYVAPGEFPADGAWRHFAFVWDLATLTWRIFIDGVESAYGLQQPGIGAYAGDAAQNLFLGNDAAHATTLDGDIQWFRVSNAKLWVADFTPPVRCTLPDIAASTVALWQLTSPTWAEDFAQAGVGILAGSCGDITRECDCIVDGSARETRTDEYVYYAPRDHSSNLNYVFWYDNGTGNYGGNLIGGHFPAHLLPDVPAVGDILYVGSDSVLRDSGPFASVVLHILEPMVDVVGVWEFYQGAPTNAWTSLAGLEQDGTAVLTEIGAYNFVQVVDAVNGDWTPTAVRGMNAWWIRFRVTGIGANPWAPTVDRQPYAVNWAFTEFQEDDVGGGFPAHLRALHRVRSLHDEERLYCGLRPLDRGTAFSPYIYCSDEQNPWGMTVQPASARTVVVVDASSATGESWTYTPAGVQPLTHEGTFQWDYNIACHYYGKFRMYLIVEQTAGVAGDIFAQVRWEIGHAAAAGSAGPNSPVRYTPALARSVVDMGRVDIPFADISYDDLIVGLYANLYLGSSNAAAVATIRALVLLPVDEWAACVTSGATVTVQHELDLDSVADVHRPFSSYSRYYQEHATFPGNIISVATPIVNGPQITQAGRTCRMWYLSCDTASTTTPELLHSVRYKHVQRYHGARGDR